MATRSSSVLAGARVWLPLYLVLALATGFVDLRMRAYPTHAVKEYIPDVVSGTADAPGRYRVLAPFAHRALVDITGADEMLVWYVTRLSWFAVAWLAWHCYLRTWFSPALSGLGTTLVVATLPLTFTNSWAHPDHAPELALFPLACLALARGRDGWFAALLVVCTLNRETAAFLVALYAAVRPWSREHLWRTAAMGALWFAVYAGLRVWRGYEGYDVWQLWRNLEFLRLLPPPYDPYYRAYAWFGGVLFGPLLWVAWLSRRAQPVFVRRALVVVPLVALVALTMSSIIETRIFTPLFALIVPGVIFTAAGTDSPS